MAYLEEIALGVTAVLLHSPEPEPMGLDLRGQTAEEAGRLISLIIMECADAGKNLSLVRVDSDLLAALDRETTGSFARQAGVPISANDKLGRRVEFYRRDPGDNRLGLRP